MASAMAPPQATFEELIFASAVEGLFLAGLGARVTWDS